MKEEREFTVKLECEGTGTSPEEAVADVVEWIRQGGNYTFQVIGEDADENPIEVLVDTESDEYRKAVGLPAWEEME